MCLANSIINLFSKLALHIGSLFDFATRTFVNGYATLVIS
jgi:hypothetical protein